MQLHYYFFPKICGPKSHRSAAVFGATSMRNSNTAYVNTTFNIAIIGFETLLPLPLPSPATTIVSYHLSGVVS